MKDNAAVAIRAVLTLLIVGNLAVLIGLAFPSQASAQTSATQVSVQTAQLLPPGSNTCTPPQISGFTPYVYDGALHAFELTVSDGSYVAIAGSAGNTGIPFNYMTRWVEPSGAVRVHVDMPTTPIGGSLSIDLTMISAKGVGQPVCITSVSTTLGAGGVPVTTPPPPAPAPAPTSPPPPAAAPAETPTTPPPPGEETTTETGVEATTSVSSIVATQNFIKDICSSAAGALRLWVVLLIVYVLIVVAAIVGQPQLPAALRTQEWAATAIVAPFLLLFGLWYFAESCRTSSWIPVIATIVALAGLSAAFWERKGTTTKNVINLPGEET